MSLLIFDPSVFSSRRKVCFGFQNLCFCIQFKYKPNDISGYLNYHIGTMSSISVNTFYYFWLIFVQLGKGTSYKFSGFLYFRTHLFQNLPSVPLNCFSFWICMSLSALYLSQVCMWQVLLKLSMVKDKLFFSFQFIIPLQNAVSIDFIENQYKIRHKMQIWIFLISFNSYNITCCPSFYMLTCNFSIYSLWWVRHSRWCPLWVFTVSTSRAGSMSQ